MGAGAARLQLATYPQSPFSGPAHCCDVTDLYQAFSQRTGPGRLWISLDAPVCCPLSIDRATKKPSRKNQPKDAELQFRPVQSEGSRQPGTRLALENRLSNLVASFGFDRRGQGS